tara:strand:- start:728 stop:1021 length:294 start_codon:yes stop_codon:yes gene_type:complete
MTTKSDNAKEVKRILDEIEKLHSDNVLKFGQKKDTVREMLQNIINRYNNIDQKIKLNTQKQQNLIDEKSLPVKTKVEVIGGGKKKRKYNKKIKKNKK